MKWNKKASWTVNARLFHLLKLAHYLGVVLCVSLMLVYLVFDIGFRGIWADRIIIALTTFTGIVLVLSDNQPTKKFDQKYFKIFSALPILAGLYFLIPLSGPLSFFHLAGNLFEKEVYYQDENLRIQETFNGLLQSPKIGVYEKTLFLEKKLHIATVDILEVDSVIVTYDTDSTRILIYEPSYDTTEKIIPKLISINPIK
ncbi:MAG: hypothetical protein AAFO07_16810 [Bacteroidota bacterium]